MHVMMPDLFIKPEYREAYIEAIIHEVKQGLEKEPEGILRFDLVQDGADPNVIHVYAVYRDEAALHFHQQQPYYVEFMQKTMPWWSKPPVLRSGRNLLPTDADWKRGR